MSEDVPHPCARMVSIKDPIFWIFFSVCGLLYLYLEFTIGHRGRNAAHLIYGDWLWMAIFTALFLTILADSVKTPSTNRLINICCYTFEGISAVVLTVLICFVA